MNRLLDRLSAWSGASQVHSQKVSEGLCGTMLLLCSTERWALRAVYTLNSVKHLCHFSLCCQGPNIFTHISENSKTLFPLSILCHLYASSRSIYTPLLSGVCQSQVPNSSRCSYVCMFICITIFTTKHVPGGHSQHCIQLSRCHDPLRIL